MIIKRIFGIGAGNIFQVFFEGGSFVITVPKGASQEQIQAVAQAKIDSMNNDQEEYEV